MVKKQEKQTPLETEEIVEDLESQDETNEIPIPANEAITMDLGELIEELDSVKGKLEEVEAQANEYLDGWQRARAEFANYKKRIEREQSLLHQNLTGNVIKRYLGVIDDMERALKNRPSDDEGAAWAEGIELIYRKLLTILENEGVMQMDAEGQEFDPTQHEAVSSEENDEFDSGQIIEVLQQGYLLGEKVLRPAMVRVAR
jgi:molecular chaperone GrpE